MSPERTSQKADIINTYSVINSDCSSRLLYFSRSSSFSLFATINAPAAAALTLVAVLAISTMELMGDRITIISIGKPAAANTAVAVMVAVPGTQTVPMLTMVVIIIRSRY